DADLVDLSSRRITLLDRLDSYRETLWPVVGYAKGRRPPAHDQAPLSPIEADARPLWGRRLRSTCLAVLRRYGPLRLRDLHELLHLHGYQIASPKPVQALGDAMAYERDEGRAIRVRRGVYDV